MGDIDSLREREKELRCLYQVQHWTLGSGLPLKEVLQKVVESLPPGWQRPATTGGCIEYFEQSYISGAYQPTGPQLCEPLLLGGQMIGRVVVSDVGLGTGASSADTFLKEERDLLRGVASLLSNFLEWKHLEVLGEHISPPESQTQPQASSLLDMEAMVKRTLLGLSHELRNPLTVITADLDLLRQSLPEQERGEVISEIQQAVSGITSMISDLMLFLRAETGVERPVLEEVEIVPFVQSLVRSYQAEADGKKVAFLGEGSDLRVRLNRVMTERILRDLIGNGILYSNCDTVQVSVDTADDQAIITVKDEGRGIDREHQDKIFEQFYRLESSRDRYSGGVGLGLPLARALARSQNGSLKLVSEPGQGTEVQLIFSPVRTV